MKKLGAALFAAMTLVPSGANAQSVGAGVSNTVGASANWVIRRSSNSALYHFVEATKTVNPIGATNTIADVGTVDCHIGEDGRAIVTSCKVLARILFIKPKDFVFDPLLRSARLVLRDEDSVHRSTWVVKEDATPSPNWFLHGDGRSLVLTASLKAGARARGRVLGERFSTKTDRGIASLRRSGEAVVIFEHEEGRYRRTYQHRSKTRRQAWDWTESLLESL